MLQLRGQIGAKMVLPYLSLHMNSDGSSVAWCLVYSLDKTRTVSCAEKSCDSTMIASNKVADYSAHIQVCDHPHSLGSWPSSI